MSLKLNLGCGKNKRDGYVNIDSRPELNPDICEYLWDLEYEPESVDEIYISHALEHVNISTARRLLLRFHKWLKLGGHLFIAVPNLTLLGKLISEGNEDEILFKWIFGSGYEGPTSHKWGFTENTLKKKLKRAGFKIIGYFPPQNDDSGFQYKGQYLSLNLECQK